MYGIKAGAYFSVSDAIELGLEAGSYAFEQDQEIDFGGGAEDFTFSGSGASVSLVCAVKFYHSNITPNQNIEPTRYDAQILRPRLFPVSAHP